MNFADLKALGHQPRVHPNGFIQLDIVPGKIRLNVWTSDGIFCGSRAHPIHNHSYDISSRILKGALTNLTYLDRWATPANATHILHTAAKVPGTANETMLTPIPKGYSRLVSQKADTYAAGEGYVLEREVLHDSLPHGLTATLMTIIQPNPYYSPMVAVPVGVKPHNFHRRETDDKVTLGLMWGWIEQAVGDLEIL